MVLAALPASSPHLDPAPTNTWRAAEVVAGQRKWARGGPRSRRRGRPILAPGDATVGHEAGVGGRPGRENVHLPEKSSFERPRTIGALAGKCTIARWLARELGSPRWGFWRRRRLTDKSGPVETRVGDGAELEPQRLQRYPARFRLKQHAVHHEGPRFRHSCSASRGPEAAMPPAKPNRRQARPDTSLGCRQRASKGAG